MKTIYNWDRNYGVLCLLSSWELWEEDCHYRSPCTCEHNTNLGDISQIIVYLNCASGVVHCSAVILNMVSLTTCSSQNRNGCIGYLGKEGPKIILMRLLLSHVIERIWKIPHISSWGMQKEDINVGDLMGIMARTQEICNTNEKRRGSWRAGGWTSFLGEITVPFP